ncbi:sulfotransferase [Neolewinella lacunae]|uniref:Sulfotransferase n=1 Tax=Neolewinella lacunae TaxID=1517758 RepID=A0A923T9V7_9BACT|nr:sulfotransferase [Neolewinella lacunae]MBC6995949.1 sulfotransferase [Neolewinella lacunae]MDN3635207.1 sulfotransferase [Neolewinella lacunae]
MPIFISSPVRRSGTTLLQRLCSATGEAIIFGETAANDLAQAGQLFQYKQQMAPHHQQWRDQILERVVAGDVNHWIPDLLPRTDTYLDLHAGALKALCAGFAAAAQEYGRREWGVKFPEWHPASLVFWQHFLPDAKVMYVVRDYEECLASARKLDMIQTDQDQALFHHNYHQHLALARQHLLPERTYFLDYAALCDARAPEELRKIAAFLGLGELPESVLAVRVGDYPSS